MDIMYISYALVNRNLCQKLRLNLDKLNYISLIHKYQIHKDLVGIPLIHSCSLDIYKDPNNDGHYILDNIPFIIQDLPISISSKKPPKNILTENIIHFMTSKNLWKESLLNDIPKTWEKFDDLIMINRNRYLTSIEWTLAGPELWTIIAKALNVSRLASRKHIKKDDFRTPQVEILLGTDSWVNIMDNKIKYSWDIRKNMFSKGNASERHRIGNLNCQNEVILDLYAGIGYFTLPFLIGGKAKIVHACEWNPSSIIALKYNLKQNNVSEKCIIYEGDNRLVCPENVADRINLGLIPTSSSGWSTACKALKSTGGILHVHENVTLNIKNRHETKSECETCKNLKEKSAVEFDSLIYFEIANNEISHCNKSNNNFWKKDEWKTHCLHVMHSLYNILIKQHSNSNWKVEILEINYVKSYGPNLDHLVFDLECKSTI